MKKYSSLVERYDELKTKFEKDEEKHSERITKNEAISAFIGTLSGLDGLISEFNEYLCNSVIEKVMAYSEDDMNFTFKDGSDILL